MLTAKLIIILSMTIYIPVGYTPPVPYGEYAVSAPNVIYIPDIKQIHICEDRHKPVRETMTFPCVANENEGGGA